MGFYGTVRFALPQESSRPEKQVQFWLFSACIPWGLNVVLLLDWDTILCAKNEARKACASYVAAQLKWVFCNGL